jgi:urease accessory protein
MRAIAIKTAATWSGEPADSVVLDYDNRRRRRVAMKGRNGTAFLLDLPSAGALRDGDALVLEDGRLIEIVAAPESLYEIHCTDAQHLACLAWHLGNRHVQTQLLPNSLRIRRDHVMAEMAAELGARVSEIEAAFEPEGGAYDGLHHHNGHDHV